MDDPPLSGRRSRILAAAMLTVGAGLAVTWAGYGPGQLGRGAVPLAAGWVSIGAGLFATARVPWSRAGALIAAAGVAWFIPLLAGCLNVEPLMHRCISLGPMATVAGAMDVLWAAILAHALLAFPSGRLPGRGRRAAVAACYVLAMAFGARQPTVGPAGGIDTDVAALALGGAALILLAALLDVDRRRAALTIDRALGLGGSLAIAIGDPTLRIMYAGSAPGIWVDGQGRQVEPAGGAAITTIERDGAVLARLEHDPAALADAQVRGAVLGAVELAAHNVRLRTDLDRQLAEVIASRRRLVETTLRERRELGERVDHDVQVPLAELVTGLAAIGGEVAERARLPDDEVAERLADAAVQLADTQVEIRDLSMGLYPPVLVSGGLGAALRDLAGRTPVPVEVLLGDTIEVPPDVAATAWFVVAEALANVVRHAHATGVRLTVISEGDVLRVTVEDDGIGGADPGSGSGLAGLRDRVEALGGHLTVDSRPGTGTRLAASIPVSDEARVA